jgi:signal transduction histidine kinase
VLLAVVYVILIFTLPPGIAENQESAASDWLFTLALFAFALMGGLIVLRRPDHRIGWLFAFVGLYGMTILFPVFAYADLALRPEYDLPFGPEAAWVTTWGWMPMTFGMILTLLVFPTGRLLSKRWLVVPVLSGAALVLLVIGSAVYLWPYRGPALLDENFPPPGAPAAVALMASLSFPVLFGALLLGCVSLILRYRRARGEERQQLKWLLYPISILFLGIALESLWTIGADQNVPFLDILGPIGALGIPVAAGIAVLRHRLLDIDVLISKTVVYGTLAALITLGSAGVIITAGALASFGGGSDGVVAIAVAIMVIAIQPLRNRLQRLANRLVYGKRATPYEAMAEFSQRLAGGLSLEEILPRMAETAASGIGATRSRVRVFLPDGEVRSASWPAGSSDGRYDRTVEVTHRGELVGEIAIAKPPAEPVTPAEEKLLSDLASQAGLALRNVRLNEDLRASRRRIVSAQDEERRRLERNLHDGAQQNLVALKVKLGLAEKFAESDPVRTRDLLSQLQREADETLENVRDLARGIYPPLLADQGLAGALDAQANKAALPVEVRDDGIGRYSPEIEAAVYFCCLEALQNVGKYAHASRVTIHLSSDGAHLSFVVEDDGGGFDPENTKRGTGLQNMTDRIDALGGSLEIRSALDAGTIIEGRVPVSERKEG